MMYALKSIKILRVSKEGELEGLDLHEHGASAYPEYALLVSTGATSVSAEGSLALENAPAGD
jgi:hypothetical protein